MKLCASSKFFQRFDEVVAVVGVDLDDERFGEVEAENTEDGLRVDDVFIALQVDLIRIILHDFDELFHVLCHLQRNFYGFHKGLRILFFYIIHKFFGKSKIFAKINLNFSEICAIMIFEQGKLSNLHRKRREYGYEQGTDRAFFAPL